MKRAILITLPDGLPHSLLVVLGPNVSNSSPEAGDTFWFIATVTNQGDERSADNRTVLPLDGRDVRLGGRDGRGGSEGPSSSYAATIRLTAPSTAGTYYYRACVDAVPGESDTTNNCSGAVSVTVSAGDDGVTEAAVVAAAAALHRNPLLLAAPVRQPLELPGDKLRIDIHGQPDATFELGIGWVSRDGSRTNLVGVIRDQSLGQTYLIVRHEGYPQIVRRWVPPYSPIIPPRCFGRSHFCRLDGGRGIAKVGRCSVSAA